MMNNNRAQHILESYFDLFYHATSLEDAITMLQSNRMDPTEVTDNYAPRGLSFSRSPIFWYKHSNRPVRFIFNSTKLKQDYQTQPFDHWREPNKQEFEYETIVKNAIHPLKKYLVGIELHQDGRFGIEPSKIQKLQDLAGSIPFYLHKHGGTYVDQQTGNVPVTKAAYLFRKGL